MPGDPVWVLFRWLHFLAGITWIGLLYYLNVINVRMMPSLDAGVRPAVITANLRRVMAWFRHAAWFTVLAGLVLIYLGYWSRGDFATTDSAKTILMGGLLGIIMAVNVWVLIWPNQKKIIEAARTGQAADPTWARIGLYASRTNFTLSFPMLFFMTAARHYPLDWLGIIVVGLILAGVGALVWMTVQKWATARF
jgi:uncharacterized membrane protein